MNLFERIRQRYTPSQAMPTVTEASGHPAALAFDAAEVSDVMYDLTVLANRYGQRYSRPRLELLDVPEDSGLIARAVLTCPSFDTPKIERRATTFANGYSVNPPIEYSIEVLPDADGATMRIERTEPRADGSTWSTEFGFLKDQDGYFPTTDFKNFMKAVEEVLDRKYASTRPGAEQDLDGILPALPEAERDNDVDDESLHSLIYR